MTPDRTNPAGVVEAIVNGEPVEWDPASASAPGLAQLRVLYEIARVHREAQLAGGAAGDTVGAPPPASVGAPTSRWAHLYLLAPIGHGASSLVYRAWDSRLAREVALKLMASGEAGGGETLAEARRLARVRHPHVVMVYGADQAAGQVGVWMELLQGRTLQELVQAQGPLSAREAALVGADVCSALAAVHGAGLLHRDIKAQNVVREHGGRIVLMDLGAGRDIGTTAPVDLAGTPLYMAPELFAGAAASVQSDLYGVGALLCFLTTGEAPVAGATLEEIRRRHAAGEGRALRDVRSDLPRRFVEIVERALSRDRAMRPGSAGELERALTASVLGEATAPAVAIDPPAPAGPAAPSRGEAPPAARGLLGRRLPLWTVLPVALAAAVLGLAAARWWPSTRGAAPAPGAAGEVIRPLTDDQAQIVFAIEDLAGTLGAEGRWAEAAAQYREAERIYRVNTSPDAPMVGAALARLAWAQQHAGDLDTARYNYELAFVKLLRFAPHPLAETTLGALATLQQVAGEHAAAADTLDRALHLRQRILLGAPEAGSGLAEAGLSAERLSALMPAHRLDADTDGDWLRDVLEAAVGLDPAARDTDGNGRPDDEEDSDGDGVPNALELGLIVDPTRVIAHFGATDPEWFGFRQPENRRVAGRPVTVEGGGPAWEVPSSRTSLYAMRLTTSQRQRALSHGWRISTRGRLSAGGAHVDVDFSPDGGRFDLDFYLEPGGGVLAHLNRSLVPLSGPTKVVSTTARWPLTELRGAPGGAATLLVGGLDQGLPAYPGHRQFLEGVGFYFGSNTAFGKVPTASAEFNLAIIAIR
jgi:serine/threonine-protein kinase